MIKNYLEKIFKELYIFHNLYIKNKVYLKRKFYSQSKEDIFVLKFFKFKTKGLYVDVGCHHPSRINNTFLLYKHGWRGINIDMSKISIELFNRVRAKDTNIHSAISCKNKIINYYTNKELFLSASLIQKKGNEKFKLVKKIKSQTLTQVLDKSKYKNSKIDFLSIDAEGADYDVLKSLNFKRYKPRIICIEIWKEQIKDSNIKDCKIYKFLTKKKYKLIKKLANNYIFSF